MSDTTPGWQADPTGQHDHRYWDGSQWTDNVSDGGVAGTDPYVADAATDATLADTPVVAPEEPAAPSPATPVDPTVAEPAPPAPDVTAAWPAAPAAPGSPTPPPPYVPTGPVSGGGGSKRGLLIGGGILAIIAIVAAVLAMAGGDDDTSDVRTQLASALERDTGLSESDAECVADFFVDDLGEDAFDGVDFSAEDPPEELQTAFTESGIKAVQECNVDVSSFGPDTTEGSDGGDSSGVTDGAALPDNYADILADTYEQSLGLSREQAECLADKLTEAIAGGDITEEDAVAGFLDYLSDCNIDPEEIGAN